MHGTDPPQRPFLARLLVNPLRPGPPAGALGEFYNQCASMLRAGLTILRTLDSLSEQAGSGRIRRRIPAMMQQISEGGTAADAFALFPSIFDPIHVAMIRAGERAGRLDDTFETLAESCKRRSRLTKIFITAVLYPVLLLHFALFALPFIERLIGDDTPYWRLALPPFAGLYGAFLLLFLAPRVLRQFPATAYVLDVVRGLIPFVSGIAEKLALGRTARALEGLYGAGVTLGDAMPAAGDACGNEILRRKLRRMAPMIESGMTLSDAMRAVGGFPSTFVNMIATGEESGQLSGMLANAADYYEDRAETALKRAAIIIPIVFYIIVACYIGFQIVRAYTQMLSQRFEGIEELNR